MITETSLQNYPEILNYLDIIEVKYPSHIVISFDGDTYESISLNNEDILVVLPKAQLDLDITTEYINQMLSFIDAYAGKVRACYITVAPGQEATYMYKEQQAKDFIAANYSGAVPSLIDAEICATGATAQVVCDTILATAASWQYLAGIIEKIRRTAKIQISQTTDLVVAKAILDSSITSFNTLIV